MSDIAIKVENLSKRYRIGQYVGSGAQYRTLRESLTNAVTAPLRRLRQTGDRRRKTDLRSPVSGPLSSGSSLRSPGVGPRSSPPGQPSTDRFIWALKDVSFEVKHGEVLGIIGRNGAGKSTLLKILTRITEPTEGRAELNGRVGSLLEVGTGFHPELTGRENVYLSGAILGMTRKEINRRFDEIVSFSEIEKFIDTPVKRYSSGMRVRLGFAVAAHLEPEILLIDEVLAVGDAEFQKKCLGKMGNVAKEGRTVIFVSHNMDAIMGLCAQAIWLESGSKAAEGSADQIVREYLVGSSKRGEWQATIAERTDRKGDGRLRFTGFQLRDKRGVPINAVVAGDSVELVLSYVTTGEPIRNVTIWLWIRDAFGRGLVTFGSLLSGDVLANLPPRGELVCHVPRFPLREGTYYVDLGADISRIKADRVLRAVKLEVVSGDFFGTGRSLPPYGGDFLCDHSWSLGPTEKQKVS